MGVRRAAEEGAPVLKLTSAAQRFVFVTRSVIIDRQSLLRFKYLLQTFAWTRMCKTGGLSCNSITVCLSTNARGLLISCYCYAGFHAP